jgi:hypothetical protein
MAERIGENGSEVERVIEQANSALGNDGSKAGSGPGETSPIGNGASRDKDPTANDPNRIGGPEIKKRRGRPSLSAAEKEARAAARAGANPGAPQTEKQSRKTAGALGLDHKLLAQQMQGLHAIAAALTGVPVLQLAEHEAEALAKAVTDLAVYYQLDFAGPVTLWVNLAATLGMIYFPKFLMMQQMKAMAKAQAASRANAPGSELNLQPQGPIQYPQAAQ